ncbi:dolichyl-diphosphooligosaccharide--protein glycosyltransferase subunit Ost2p [Monosporozyma unispora]
MAAQTTLNTTSASANRQSKQSNSVWNDFVDAYNVATKSYWDTIKENKKLRLIDTFCLFLVLIGIIQFTFMCLIRDNFPFNGFLSGFIICVGQFVLLISLRMQYVNPFPGISKNKALGEFVVASLMLHFVCLHFIN